MSEDSHIAYMIQWKFRISFSVPKFSQQTIRALTFQTLKSRFLVFQYVHFFLSIQTKLKEVLILPGKGKSWKVLNVIPLTKSLNSSLIPNLSSSFSCSTILSVFCGGATPSAIDDLMSSACFAASALISSARLEASAAISLDRFIASVTISPSLAEPILSSDDRRAASSAKFRALFQISISVQAKCSILNSLHLSPSFDFFVGIIGRNVERTEEFDMLRLWLRYPRLPWQLFDFQE